MARKQAEKSKNSEYKGTTSASGQARSARRVQVSAEALPRRPLEKALAIAKVLHETYAGKSATWEDLAGALEMKPNNPGFKYIVWSAQAYGIVAKEEDKQISLAETGRKIVAPTDESEDRDAKVKAVMTPTTLSKFYSDYNGHAIPSSIHFPNVLETKYGIPRTRTEEAIDLISANGRFAGILHDQGSGQPPVVRLAEFSVKATPPDQAGAAEEPEQVSIGSAQQVSVPADWENICFFITPIGEEGTEVRKHADMLLRHLLEPVAKEFGLTVIRADKIERSGMITQQVLEHLVKANLCVADLSFGNPNAFYELGVRHTCQLPAIQIIRKGDKIPFDVAQGRTITIDTSETYTVIDRVESAKRELTEHIKHLRSNDAGSFDDNPVKVYLPGLTVQIPT